MIDEIMLDVAGIWPMGIPLQDPSVMREPLVSFSPEQKLMKFASSLANVRTSNNLWKEPLNLRV